MASIDVPVLQWPDKDPNEVLDYNLDWTARLAGDTISTSTWTIDSDQLLVINSQTFAATNSTVWLSGGTVGTMYDCKNQIMTAAGRTMDQSVLLQITQK